MGLMKLVTVGRRTESRGNEVMNLAPVGVPLEGGLGEQQLAVEGDFEATAGARQQRRPRHPGRPRGEEFSHQTGGSFGVVSDDAELDYEFVRSIHSVSVHASMVRGTG